MQARREEARGALEVAVAWWSCFWRVWWWRIRVRVAREEREEEGFDGRQGRVEDRRRFEGKLRLRAMMLESLAGSSIGST